MWLREIKNMTNDLIENTHIYYPMIDSLSKNKELVL